MGHTSIRYDQEMLHTCHSTVQGCWQDIACSWQPQPSTSLHWSISLLWEHENTDQPRWSAVDNCFKLLAGGDIYGALHIIHISYHKLILHRHLPRSDGTSAHITGSQKICRTLLMLCLLGSGVVVDAVNSLVMYKIHCSMSCGRMLESQKFGCLSNGCIVGTSDMISVQLNPNHAHIQKSC